MSETEEYLVEMSDTENDATVELIAENEADDQTIRITDLEFVKAVEAVAPVLLQKSLAPKVKIAKKKANSDLIGYLLAEHSFMCTEAQATKRLANLKQRVKKKSDLKQTGNKPIVLTKVDKLLLDLMNAQDNPSIKRVASK